MCALAAHRQATAAWLHGDILTIGDTQHFLLDGLPLSRSDIQQVIFLRVRAAATFVLAFVVMWRFFCDLIPALVLKIDGMVTLIFCRIGNLCILAVFRI
jgi:hypothetical protein